MSDAPLIQLVGVTKTYGQGATALQALKGVDLRIDAGDFVAIMGPSGSGKSTAMNTLGCLDTPTTGEYIFNGVHVERLSRDQRALLLAHLPTMGPATLLLNALILLGAWVLASAYGLRMSERIAVVTECGLQNSALGIYVAVQLLHAPAMSVPSVVYALLMNGGALIFVALMRFTPMPRRQPFPQ